jgi:two-component system, LuxR family, response regulator FixJ
MAFLTQSNTALALAAGPPHDRESNEAAKRIARLSPRERQVLDGLVAGSTTKQITHDLGISTRTVEEHRARMLVRLGKRSPAEAIRLALAGLAQPDLEVHDAHGRSHGGIQLAAEIDNGAFNFSQMNLGASNPTGQFARG